MKKQCNQGITLIALVISIIVILILAGVTIATLTGDNGILSRTQDTKGTNAYYSAEEQAKLAYMAVKTEIMTQKVANSSYNAQDNAGKLAKMVKQDLSGSEWTVELKGTTVTSETSDTEIGNNINIKYTNSSIRKDSITEGKPALNGEVKYIIKLEEQDATLSERLLPSEFQQVEYIESTGTQWIDTKVKQSDYFKNLKGYIDFQFTNLLNNGISCIGGCRNTYNSDYFFILLDNSKRFQSNIGHGNLLEINLSDSDNYRHILKFDCSSSTCNYDNMTFNYVNSDANVPYNIYLFAYNNNNSGVSRKSYLKIYKMSLRTSDDILIRNFIPCYSITAVTDANGIEYSKDTIGLYDTIEGKFYTNQGTGEFLKGEDV